MQQRSQGTARRRRWMLRLGQVFASVLVLVLLLRDTDLGALTAVWARTIPGWLLLALGVKAVALVLHEIRLWLAFNPPRPPLRPVVGIGLAAGLLNLVLPARAGDVAAIGLLRRECRVSLGAATAAVGVASFLEAAVFGLGLVVVLLAGAGRWDEILGAAAHREALQWVTLATLGGIAVAAAGVIVGRRLGVEEPGAPGGPSPLAVIREILRQASDNLAAPLRLVGQVLITAVDVGLTVAAFALALPALGIDVPLPLLAAAGVLAVSSLAAVVLPPTYGAGPAAASVAVLAAFGVDQAGAIAFAGAYWLISQLPAVALGLPCLPGRGRIRVAGRVDTSRLTGEDPPR